MATIGDCYDRYLVRIEEMRQSVKILRQCLDQIPGGADNVSKEPVNVPDMKVALPPKETRAHEDGGIDSPFHQRDQGVNVPPGEVYFSAENPKGELGFYIQQQRRWHAAPDEDPFAHLSESEHLAADVAGAHGQRHHGDSWLVRLRDGRV